MNRILFFSSIQIFAIAVLLYNFKTNGYTNAALFSRPSQYFLLMLPLVLIISIFSFVITVFHKTKDKVAITYKVLALILTIMSAVYIAWMPWAYIVVGTSLQAFLMIMMCSIFIIEITLFSIYKIKNKN